MIFQKLKIILCSLAFIVAVANMASAQTFNCAAGRIVYAKKYADLFSNYTGTAAVVEGCSAACEQTPEEERIGCFVIACGFGCLAIGMSNCMDYYSQKMDIDGFRDGIEKICYAEEEKKNARKKEADRLAWSLADTRNTAAAFQAYLDECNDVCAFKSAANAKIRLIRKKQDAASWEAASTSNTIEAYRAYLNGCGSVCAFMKDAEANILRFQKTNDDAAWAIVQKSGSVSDAQNYLRNCSPLCAHASKARKIVNVVETAQKAQNEAVFTALFLGLAFVVFEPNVALVFLPLTSPHTAPLLLALF